MADPSDLEKRLRVCDCLRCHCAAPVKRQGHVCAGCRDGSRCVEIRKLTAKAFP